MSELDKILADIDSSDALQATRADWNPERRGEIDIRIAADGAWYHEGRRFQRDSLVKLFAGILRREQDGYYLVTPAEKLRITVDDAPFVAPLVDRVDDNGSQAIVFTTNLDERIVADRDHPIRVQTDETSGEPRPYVTVRNGLEALIGRGAFYELASFAEETERDGQRCLCLHSRGVEFKLGSIDE